MQKNYSRTVEGMTCGNCALSITKLLEKKGATQVMANAASGDVSFSLPEQENVDTYLNAIESLGYHVVRDEEGTTAQSHPHNHTDVTSLLLWICVALTIPLLAHMFVSWHVLHQVWVQFALATPVFAIGCYVFAPSAFRSLKHGLPNMDVLIIIGATAAYVYSLIGLFYYTESAHNYIFFETAASIITLVMLGNWLEHKTIKSTTVAIDELVQLQPQKARIVMMDSIGKETILDTESRFVRGGDIVLVNTGDPIPTDAEIVSGDALIDEKMISGESMPVRKTIGDAVVGGTILLQGNLRLRATNVGANSVLSGIIKMIREAQSTKPKLQKLADRISAIFVPAVLGIALLTFLVNYFFVVTGFSEAMMRSIAVLVISCPCAMGLATPAAISVGLGRAARNGILVKGGDTLSHLKSIRQIVFDKTGTLTTGDLAINKYQLYDIDESLFKSVVVALEQKSSHPIAQSILKQWTAEQTIGLSDIQEIKGNGMEATDTDGGVWQLGSVKWLSPVVQGDADLYLMHNGQLKASMHISDRLRDDAVATIQLLQSRGYKTILLSGDKVSKCNEIGQLLGMDEVYGEQSPEQKNQQLSRLMAVAPTAMVGDGINDAAALARATVGISLSESSQIAINSAHIILSNNRLSSLPKALKLGIFTDQTIKQNLFWAFIYNVLAIPIAASGLLTPTWGAGVMALSDVVLILNSLRLGIRNIEK
jgi:P-type Cu+ transporter